MRRSKGDRGRGTRKGVGVRCVCAGEEPAEMSGQEGLTHHPPRADSGPRFFFAHHLHVLVAVVCNPLDSPIISILSRLSDCLREHPTRSLDYPYGEIRLHQPCRWPTVGSESNSCQSALLRTPPARASCCAPVCPAGRCRARSSGARPAHKGRRRPGPPCARPTSLSLSRCAVVPSVSIPIYHRITVFPYYNARPCDRGS
jgi:hypothetical protein